MNLIGSRCTHVVQVVPHLFTIHIHIIPILEGLEKIRLEETEEARQEEGNVAYDISPTTQAWGIVYTERQSKCGSKPFEGFTS